MVGTGRLAMQSPINKRKRTAHPIVKDYVGLVGALRGVLGDLGLSRQSRDAMSLSEYLQQRSSQPQASANAALWTRLRCARCRYESEHPGRPTPSDLDTGCRLRGAMLGAVTVYRVSETGV